MSFFPASLPPLITGTRRCNEAAFCCPGCPMPHQSLYSSHHMLLLSRGLFPYTRRTHGGKRSGLQYPQRPDKRREQTRNSMRQAFGHLPSPGNLAHCLLFPHLWEGMIHDMAGAQQPWDEHHSQVVIPSHPHALAETVYCSRENGVPRRGFLCAGLWVCAGRTKDESGVCVCV